MSSDFPLVPLLKFFLNSCCPFYPKHLSNLIPPLQSPHKPQNSLYNKIRLKALSLRSSTACKFSFTNLTGKIHCFCLESRGAEVRKIKLSIVYIYITTLKMLPRKYMLLLPSNAWQKILPSNKKNLGFTTFLVPLPFPHPNTTFSPTSSLAGGVRRHPHPRNWYNAGQVTYKLVFCLLLWFFACWFACSCWFVGLCFFSCFSCSFCFFLFFVYLPCCLLSSILSSLLANRPKGKELLEQLENSWSTKPEA